jgi:hypothetical protein
MKATALALLVVSAYWVQQGITTLKQDTLKGTGIILLGLVLLPLAKYLWSKKLGGSGSSQ